MLMASPSMEDLYQQASQKFLLKTHKNFEMDLHPARLVKVNWKIYFNLRCIFTLLNVHI